MPIRRLVQALLPLALLAGCSDSVPEGASHRPENRLLMVGWDGATFDLIDPLIEAGRMPNLAGLLARGTSARLASTIVPISSAAWVGAVTGKGPGATGVYSFFEPVEDSYDVRLITAQSNAATPIWRTLTGRGLHANVIGVPVTWPPEPVLGTMIAGMLSPFDSAYAWPAAYTDELRARGFVPDLGIWREDQELSPASINQQLAIKEAVVLEHLNGHEWDFSMVVFKSLDVLSHRAYDGQPDTAVAGLLQRLDGILGRMVAAAGPDTNVIVMSDHGFANYPRAFNLHAWLIDEGFAVLRDGTSAADAAAGPLAGARALEHKRRIEDLDLARTRAFATTSEGNFGSLRLNLAGREPEGIVPAEDRENTLAAITAKLLELRASPGEVPLVKRVLRGNELYPGDAKRVVPDLLVEVTEDVQVVSTNLQPTHVQYDAPRPDHARDGILVLAGPSIAQSPERGEASIFDIAPTALHLLSQPVFEEMTGSVHASAVKPGAAPKVIRETDDPFYRTAEEASLPYSSEELEGVRDRLRQLGYVE